MQRDAKGRFKSGNPGRQRGSRNRATLAAETLLTGEAEKLARKAVELALSGDTMALKLCMDRICPTPRGRRIAIDMPRLEKAEDAPGALAAIVGAVGAGRISSAEGQQLAALVDHWRSVLRTEDLERRIEALEAAQEHQQ